MKKIILVDSELTHLSFFSKKKYFQQLNLVLQQTKLSVIWDVLDLDAGDIRQITRLAKIIVCFPGLQFQFVPSDFDSTRMIYLTCLEAWGQETTRVMSLVRSLSL